MITTLVKPEKDVAVVAVVTGLGVPEGISETSINGSDAVARSMATNSRNYSNS
jgi:hypothetical protein